MRALNAGSVWYVYITFFEQEWQIYSTPKWNINANIPNNLTTLTSSLTAFQYFDNVHVCVICIHVPVRYSFMGGGGVITLYNVKQEACISVLLSPNICHWIPLPVLLNNDHIYIFRSRTTSIEKSMWICKLTKTSCLS